MLNTGPHGLSEVLYAFTSATQQQRLGVRRASRVNTTWYNTALGLAMLLGRFLPIIFVLGLAGSLAAQKPVPASAGTLPTHQPLFVGMVVGVTVILVALTFLPALALGPLAEGSVGGPRTCLSPPSTRPGGAAAGAASGRAGSAAGCSTPSSCCRSTPGRAAQARPAHAVAQPGHVHRRDRLGVHHRPGDRRPDACSPG